MNKRYADIIVDISQEKLDKSFQYEIPSELIAEVEIGKKVRIPFGNGGRQITGYVIGISGEPKLAAEKIKAILGVEEQGIQIESKLIALAAWIAQNYGSTMNQALKTVLPVKEKAAVKNKRYLCLIASKEICLNYLEQFQKKHFKAKERLLKALMEEPNLEYTRATGELKVSTQVIRGFVEEQILSIETERCYRNVIHVVKREEKTSTLTSAQEAAVQDILKEWEESKPRPCLLKGVTGSGKTAVYMALIEKMLAQGKQVIVLIPEIALTYQNVSRFYNRFGDCVSVMNSRLSPRGALGAV